ncbi:MAG: PQ-loop domain-containing transporter [Candidatus Gastranaerophilales bacterium]|nr:PQ-loop domain-containing transporter [Candidatus Gastranaerophilales bacterium]
MIDNLFHNMSFYEAGMLICFGASWPMAVYKTYKAKSVEGKSMRFLLLVLTGYVFGIVHKFLYNFDAVLFIYFFNATLVVIDMILYIYYRFFYKREVINV